MFDVAVIGLGPGGMEAVNIALKNNLKVIAFEKADIGGCCLNLGCIPTKTILHSAKVFSEFKKAENLGISLSGNVEFDWLKILKRKDDIVSKFKNAAGNALSKNITLVTAEAKIAYKNGKTSIIANNDEYYAKNIIVSTGSTPREIPDLKFNHNDILSSDDLFKLQTLPKTLTIVGSGAIGIEWGIIMASFGVEVTIIEKMPNLAPNMDLEISKRLERILKLNKIKYYKNDFITSFKDNNVVLNSGVEFNAEKVLVAVGRKPIYPNLEGINDFELKNHYETNIDNLYFIGDATGIGMLAHSASMDARNVMNKILFNKEYDFKLIPAVIYIHPEIASVGIKEQDADESYQIKKLPIASVAKAWADDSTDGLIKLIIKDNLIKGASVISNEASSIITTLQAFIENKTSINEIESFVFAHPTYSEIIAEVIKRG